MKKGILIFLAIMLVFPTALALDLEVNETDSKNVFISELDEPVTVTLEIKNLGEDNTISFINPYGAKMNPSGKIPISSGETKEIELEIYPRKDLNYRGTYIFKYSIRGENFERVDRNIKLELLELEDVFEIGSSGISSEEGKINVYLRNNVGYSFEDVRVSFSSVFFEFEETLSLNPGEERTFSVDLNEEQIRKLLAGFYTMEAEINVQEEIVELEESIRFEEEKSIKTVSEEHGFVISTDVIEKINEGNVVEEVEIAMDKNIISRLFTSFSPEPSVINRDGFNVYYVWIDNLNPGENLRVNARTNWLFPLIVIFFIVAIVVLTKIYIGRNVVLRKRVNFVRAKGGEFALKVTLVVSARNEVEKVSVIDRLPPLVKLHEKFGTEKPTRVDEKKRRIEWYFNELNKGEKRVISYIIYSKVGVLGRFALPSAAAIYEKDGKIQESSSNKAFFVAEQKGKIEGDN